MLHDGGPLSLSRGTAGGVTAVLATIRGLPLEEEMWGFLVALRTAYAAHPAGFLLVYDMAELEEVDQPGLCYDRALQLAGFYRRPEMRSLRLRATEVLIVTRSEVLRCIIATMLGLFPSPVRVSCLGSVADAGLPADAARALEAAGDAQKSPPRGEGGEAGHGP